MNYTSPSQPFALAKNRLQRSKNTDWRLGRIAQFEIQQSASNFLAFIAKSILSNFLPTANLFPPTVLTAARTSQQKARSKSTKSSIPIAIHSSVHFGAFPEFHWPFLEFSLLNFAPPTQPQKVQKPPTAEDTRRHPQRDSVYLQYLRNFIEHEENAENAHGEMTQSFSERILTQKMLKIC